MLKIEELEQKLKNEELASVYLLFGEETFLIDSNLKKIKKCFGDTVKGINYILIDEETVDSIISDIETPAFGYEKKLIVAKNTGLFKKEGKKKNATLIDLKEKLNDYIKENIGLIQESVILVFIEEEADKCDLLTTVDSVGVVCKFDYQKPAQIVKRLKVICKGYRVNVDLDVLQYFIECCGTSMQDLINEIRKLIEYAGESGTITKEDIDKLCIKKLDSVIFDLTDSLGKKDIATALQVLNNLIYTKEPIQKILITLYNHFRKLYITKIAIKNNKDLIESLNLKPTQTFLVRKYTAQSKYFEEEELKKILEELIDLEHKYKIGLIDVNIGLEAILCTYCS